MAVDKCEEISKKETRDSDLNVFKGFPLNTMVPKRKTIIMLGNLNSLKLNQSTKIPFLLCTSFM